MPDLLIVGAGPAGLAAAVTAGRLGLECVVVDENPSAGGQYYRQPQHLEPAGSRLDGQQRRGRMKIDQAAAAATMRLGSAVVGLGSQRRAWINHDGEGYSLDPRCVLLATGAHDRPVAFPGWTLPGVMAAGSAQALVKSQEVRPGRRAVVAGSGAFLFVVAANLLKVGVDVVEVVEAATARTSLPHLPGALRYPSKLAEFAGYLLPLIRARTRIRQGEIIASASGDGHLQEVRTRPISARGDGGRGRERVIDADLLCVGYGFSASTELARLAGCALVWNEGLRQRVPARDEWQATSAEGIFVAGEACGLGGSLVAESEGELAAIGVARHLGRIREVEAREMAEPIWRRLRGQRRFAGLLPALFPAPPQLAELPLPDTIVCRCENVTLGRALEAVRHQGASTLNEVKTTTRCGMGWCQGRICGSVLPSLLAERTGTGFDTVPEFTARYPVRPVPVSSMAGPERPGDVTGV